MSHPLSLTTTDDHDCNNLLLQCVSPTKNILSYKVRRDILKPQINVVRPIKDRMAVDQSQRFDHKKMRFHILNVSHSYHPDSTVWLEAWVSFPKSFDSSDVFACKLFMDGLMTPLYFYIIFPDLDLLYPDGHCPFHPEQPESASAYHCICRCPCNAIKRKSNLLICLN